MFTNQQLLGMLAKPRRTSCEHCCDCTCHEKVTMPTPPMVPFTQPWRCTRNDNIFGIPSNEISDNVIDFTRSAREFTIELEGDDE